MTSYGMNPQGGQMAPLDLDVAETCALGHMCGVLTVFGHSESTRSARPQSARVSTSFQSQFASSLCRDAQSSWRPNE